LVLEYIGLAPGFAREVLEIYEAWEGKEALPWKVKELMLVLQIEVNRRYNPNSYPQASQLRKSRRIQGEQTRLYPPAKRSGSSQPSAAQHGRTPRHRLGTNPVTRVSQESDFLFPFYDPREAIQSIPGSPIEIHGRLPLTFSKA
jgi:hypothetical protein